MAYGEKRIHVYENWSSEVPSKLGVLYVDSVKNGEHYHSKKGASAPFICYISTPYFSSTAIYSSLREISSTKCW